MMFLPAISDEEIGRVVRRVVVRVVQRVWLPSPRSSDNTSDEEIGACNNARKGGGDRCDVNAYVRVVT